ncbi:MAG: hypothetical protein AAGH41_08120 [Pseudomonadota bacterium]
MALLATLAAAKHSERTRVWLQQTLWGSRSASQAQSSLRRELSNLRKLLNAAGIDILDTDYRTVRLKRENIDVDIHAADAVFTDFLEGLDLAGEEGFEDWLREMRNHEEPAEHAPALLSEPTHYNDNPFRAPARSAHANLQPTISIETPLLSADDGSLDELAQRAHLELSTLMMRPRLLPTVATPPRTTALTLRENATAEPQSTSRFIARAQAIATGRGQAISFALIEMPDAIIRWSETRMMPKNPDDHTLRLEAARATSSIAAAYQQCLRRLIDDNDPIASQGLFAQIWRIRFCIDALSPSALDEADILMRRALVEHPHDSEVLMTHAHLTLWRHWMDRADPEETHAIGPMIRAAMRSDPMDARGPLFSGILSTWHRQTTDAIDSLSRACRLDPSSAQAFSHHGSAYMLAGDAQSALGLFEKALFLAPLDPNRFFIQGQIASALWMLERYEDALKMAHETKATRPGYVLAHAIEVASLNALGRGREARRIRAQLIDRKQDLYKSMLKWFPFTDQSWIERLHAQVEGSSRTSTAVSLAGNAA